MARNSTVLTTVLSLFLAGCGGGSSTSPNPPVVSQPPPPDPVITGTLAGPLVGLRYETATLNGVTDAAGAFSFRSGEEIAFSIGGVELGRTTAAANLSLFDLFGAAPPTSESALRIELESDDATPFGVAINAALFLSLLDDDLDPRNGFDVAAWDVQLTQAQLSLDQSIEDFHRFYLPRFMRTLSARRNADPISVVRMLYASINVQVSAELLVEQLNDEGSDGVITGLSEFERRYVYDDNGNRIESVTVLRRSTESFKSDYDERGNLIRQVNTRDTNADGLIDKIEIRTGTYNDENALLSAQRTEDREGDGTVDEVRTTDRTYDSNGNRTSEIRATDRQNDGFVDTALITTDTYADNGDRLSRVIETDNGMDGKIDGRNTRNYQYDPRGNQLVEEEIQDNDADGTIDRINTLNTAYNERDLKLSETDVGDDGADGVFEQVETIVWTYDDATNRLSRVEEKDTDGDGRIDTTEDERWSYNELGYETSWTRTTIDRDPNGIFTIDESFYVYSYDSNGNRTSSYREDRTDAVLASTEARTSTYDASGRRLTLFVERDEDADGFVDSTTLDTTVYTAGGNTFSNLREEDTDGDGNIDEVVRESFRYEQLADGVHVIVAYYFPRNQSLPF